jgi:hypothetical protein
MKLLTMQFSPTSSHSIPHLTDKFPKKKKKRNSRNSPMQQCY